MVTKRCLCRKHVQWRMIVSVTLLCSVLKTDTRCDERGSHQPVSRTALCMQYYPAAERASTWERRAPAGRPGEADYSQTAALLRNVQKPAWSLSKHFHITKKSLSGCMCDGSVFFSPVLPQRRFHIFARCVKSTEIWKL